MIPTGKLTWYLNRILIFLLQIKMRGIRSMISIVNRSDSLRIIDFEKQNHSLTEVTKIQIKSNFKIVFSTDIENNTNCT